MPSAPGAPPNSLFTVLSARNLVRGLALRVPTGQYVAKRMNVKPLSEEQLLSSPIENPTAEQQAQHQRIIDLLRSHGGLLLEKTPLWYYVLKEAEVLHAGNQMGPAGGRIIAEVFMRLLAETEESFINTEGWKPRFGVQGSEAEPSFRIVDLLRFAGAYPTPDVN